MSHPTPRYIPDTPIAPGTTIGHVHLKSANLAGVRAFYVDILGFSIMAEMPTALFLSAGAYHHTLAFNTWESLGSTPPPPGYTGLYHVALRYEQRHDLADALRRLRKAGWPLEGTSDHGTHEALYLRDPDDNGLELYWDRPEEAWPRDQAGHLIFTSKLLDLQSLLAA